jgi:hypothetical protein
MEGVQGDIYGLRTRQKLVTKNFICVTTLLNGYWVSHLGGKAAGAQRSPPTPTKR